MQDQIAESMVKVLRLIQAAASSGLCCAEYIQLFTPAQTQRAAVITKRSGIRAQTMYNH